MDESLDPPAPPCHLIRRVSNDHVELHVASKELGNPSSDVVGVNECVGMVFKSWLTVEDCTRCAAIPALAFRPCVFDALKPYVAGVAGETGGDGVLALGML